MKRPSKERNPLDRLNPRGELTLWRYFDFPKFVAMLEAGALFFSRLDLLGDPFEGSVTQSDLRAEEERWRAMADRSGIPLEWYREFFRKRASDPRLDIFVNCWHANSVESVAMWHQYVSESKGIAVVTTTKKLRAQIPSEARLRHVRYIDFDKAAVGALSPVYFKRASFAHEREIRATIWQLNLKSEPGLLVPVDLNSLIGEIRVSPGTPTWVAELVIRLCSRLGVTAPVRRSELEASPVFNWKDDV